MGVITTPVLLPQIVTPESGAIYVGIQYRAHDLGVNIAPKSKTTRNSSRKNNGQTRTKSIEIKNTQNSLGFGRNIHTH